MTRQEKDNNNDDDIIMESMEDKLDRMHFIAFQIQDIVQSFNEKTCNYEIKNLNDDESDLLYAIVDGLTVKYIIDRLTGKCSLQAMLDSPIEKLEKIIDDEIVGLLEIAKKYNMQVD